MSLFHHHLPLPTGRRIQADFGKDNLPDGIRPVLSTGEEARCAKCRKRLIVHDRRFHFAELFTELEGK